MARTGSPPESFPFGRGGDLSEARMIDSGTSAVPKVGNRHLLGCHGAREKGGFIERVGARVPKFGRAPRFENVVVGAPMDAVLLQQYLKLSTNRLCHGA